MSELDKLKEEYQDLYRVETYDFIAISLSEMLVRHIRMYEIEDIVGIEKTQEWETEIDEEMKNNWGFGR